jgi:hypothetical protein
MKNKIKKYLKRNQFIPIDPNMYEKTEIKNDIFYWKVCFFCQDGLVLSIWNITDDITEYYISIKYQSSIIMKVLRDFVRK